APGQQYDAVVVEPAGTGRVLGGLTGNTRERGVPVEFDVFGDVAERDDELDVFRGVDALRQAAEARPRRQVGRAGHFLLTAAGRIGQRNRALLPLCGDLVGDRPTGRGTPGHDREQATVVEPGRLDLVALHRCRGTGVVRLRTARGRLRAGG